MDAAAAIRFINEIEGDFPVASWRLSGVRAWPIVRGELWWAMNDDFSVTRGRVRAGSLLGRRVNQLIERPAQIARWAAVQLRHPTSRDSTDRPADAVILGDSISRIPLEGVWFDRHTEPLVDALDELGCSSLQLDLHHIYRAPTHRPSVHIQPAMDVLWLRTRAGLPAARAQPLAEYPEVLARIRAAGYEIPAIAPPVLRRQANHLRAVADWFRRVLERTDAKLGVLVDNGLVHMGFNLACAEHGIPSVEIQHGGQIGNARYAAWTALPPGGYLELPSHYWCWSQSEAADINAWASGCERHTPVVGGNLWLRAWIEETAPMAAHYDAVVHTMGSKGPDPLDVLVTLSTGHATQSHLAGLRDAISAAPRNWHWWIRSHPTMPQEEFACAVAALRGSGHRGVLETSAHELPLYALLRRAAVHVTQISTAVIEAQQFGVPSIMTESSSVGLFPEQLATGWMVIAETGDEILAGVQHQIARRAELPAPPDPCTLPRPADLVAPLLARDAMGDSEHSRSALR